jgi:predicted XRE-type DNA-binding protein
MKKLTTEVTITESTGNVFADLGFSPAQAKHLRMRSELMSAVRKFIEQENLTQAAAAKHFRVSQPRISDLMTGKLSRFSLDSLVNMLSRAGFEVDLRIKPASRHVA